MTDSLVWIDRDYDRRKAHPGTSRYANYLRRNADLFDGDGRIGHAISAWHVATSPIMSPGYVRHRPDLESVVLGRDDDAELIAAIEIRLPHRRLAEDARVRGLADWQLERPWAQFDSPHYEYCDPRPGRTALLLTVRIVLRLNAAGLGEPDGDGLDVDLAMRTCDQAAAAINRAAGPIVETLRSSR